MLPQTSRKENFDHLLFGLPINGNTSDKAQSARDSFNPPYVSGDGNVVTSSFRRSGNLEEALNDQIKPGRHRNLVEAFVQPPSKARETNSLRKTRLCVELSSGYKNQKSSSFLKPQNGSLPSSSNSKISSSNMGHKISKKKTLQKGIHIGRSMSNRASKLHSNQTKFEDGKNPSKSYSIDPRRIRLPVYSQIARISPDYSTASYTGSKAEVNLSINKADDSKNNHKQSQKFLSDSLNTENSLTSSIPVDYFHFNTGNFSRKLTKSLNFSTITRSISQSKQKSPYLSKINKSIDKDLALSKCHQQEKSNPILIDLLSSPDIEKPLEATEIKPALHLKPQKYKTKPPLIKKSRKKNSKIHQDVPVPDPIYYPFKCEWEGCRAELMNMEILRKHVYVAHGKKLEDGGRRCLWGKCGLTCKEKCTEEFITANPNTNGPAIGSNISYVKRRDWKKHMEEIHLIPFSWHMGDGPCGSRLAKPSTVWQQSYLFLADGRQITPSVAFQPIEKGVMRKLNASRFHWQQGGPFGSKILVPMSQF